MPFAKMMAILFWLQCVMCLSLAYTVLLSSWWRHEMETFSALLALCAGNSPVTGEFSAQRPVMLSFDVSLVCVWINDWVNNCEAGDLRRHRAHYDVTVMGRHCASKYLSTMRDNQSDHNVPWSTLRSFSLSFLSIFFLGLVLHRLSVIRWQNEATDDIMQNITKLWEFWDQSV